MSSLKKIFLTIVLVLNVGSQASENNMPEFDFYGWINIEYGSSTDDELIGKAEGHDRLGAQQSALGVKASRGKYSGVFTIGGDAFSNGDGDGNNYAIRDSFIVYDDKEDRNFRVSAGAQPILFGLKPNGFPGDRSIRSCVEYGGAGGYNVGFQGLTSVKFDYFIKDLEINAVIFDTNETSSAVDSDGEIESGGSSVSGNNVFQLRYKNNGLYIGAGSENRYLGSTNESKAITFVGAGFGNNQFDISVEQITLDEQFTGTDGYETVTVAELTWFINEKFSAYVDNAIGAEAEISTNRFGIKYALNDFSSIQLEHGQEKRADDSTPRSFDARWQVKF